MPPTGTERRLVLLRHGKSAYPHGVPDHERPLAGKGRRNAQAVGTWFVREGPRPDRVLCSDAIRARQTWELVAGALRVVPPLVFDPRLYLATPDEVIEIARASDPAVTTLVVVGHEPTLSGTTLLLAGDHSDPVALSRVTAKFPTNAIAVLRFTVAWAGLSTGRAALETFAVPRA